EVILKDALPGKVQLLGAYGNQNLIEDSAISDSAGRVVFKNPKRHPEGLYYVLYSDNSVVSFLLNRNQKFFLHSEKADVVSKMKTNSAENEVYYSNLVFESDL